MSAKETNSPSETINKINEKRIDKRAPSSVFSVTALTYFTVLVFALAAYLLFWVL